MTEHSYQRWESAGQLNRHLSQANTPVEAGSGLGAMSKQGKRLHYLWREAPMHAVERDPE